MATEVVMPKLGLTMQSGKVTQWLKREGDEVRIGEPLLEIESEKVSFTVEAAADGILRRILLAEGQETAPGTPVGYIGSADEEIPVDAAPAPVAAPAAPPTAAPRSAPAAEVPEGGYSVSPAARKLAKERGIDITRVRPSGRSGRVTTDDVLAFQQAAQTGDAGGGRAVRFYSDGLALAGTLFLPPDLRPGERRAGVVLCTGIQGLKELGMPELAQQLTASGLVAFSFDYRGFGDSEGARWRLLPHEQVRDVRAALTILGLQAEVDPGRLALLGFSFGGGHALAAAAEDERARAVVAIEPVTNGRRWLRSLRREWEWRGFLEQLAQDRAARATGGASQQVSLYEVMPPDPETKVVIEALAKQRPDLELEPRITLESAEAIVDYRPEYAVGRIAPRATLVIHGEMDVLVPLEESAAAVAGAGEPRRLEVLAGMGHLNWQRPGHPVFGQVTSLAADWLRQHLG